MSFLPTIRQNFYVFTFIPEIMEQWLIDHMLNRGLIDRVDASILVELSKDARRSTQSIADAVRISRPTAHERIRKLVDRGMIMNFSTRIDYFKADLPIRAYILVSYDHRIGNPEIKQKTIAKLLSKIRFVRKVSIITGVYDFLVEVWIDDMRTLADVIIEEMREIPGVGQTQTMIMFDEYIEGVRSL